MRTIILSTILLISSGCKSESISHDICDVLTNRINEETHEITIIGEFRTDGMHGSVISPDNCPNFVVRPRMRSTTAEEAASKPEVDRMRSMIFDDAIQKDGTLIYRIVAKGNLLPSAKSSEDNKEARRFEISEVIAFERVPEKK